MVTKNNVLWRQSCTFFDRGHTAQLGSATKEKPSPSCCSARTDNPLAAQRAFPVHYGSAHSALLRYSKGNLVGLVPVSQATPAVVRMVVKVN